jgi:hypothetical protein
LECFGGRESEQVVRTGRGRQRPLRFKLIKCISDHPRRSDNPPLPGFPPFTFRSSTDTNIHTILVGPRFSYRKKEKITPFGHALFGVSRTHIESQFSLRDSFEDSFTVSDTTFAMAIGAGLDVKLSNSLALRVIQADYLYKRVGRDERNNLRAGVGIVFRFGDK